MRGAASPRVRCAILALALCASPHAHALLPRLPPETEYKSGSQGAVVAVSIGTSAVGDTLMGELGGESTAIRTLQDQTYLLRWDTWLSAKGGELANQHPYFTLLGGRTHADVEFGRRFSWTPRWSLYAGGGASLDLGLLAATSLGLGSLDTANAMDGVGGLTARGALRVEGGGSWIDGRRSLLLVVFVEESARNGGTRLPGIALTSIGVSARFDIANRLFLACEASWGRSLTASDAVRGLSDRTMHESLSLSIRKIFERGMWLGAALSLAVDKDHTVYTQGMTYDTSDAPSFGLLVTFGVPLGRRWW